MRAAHQPEAFGIVMEPDEMDVMVEVWRMFVRDYEATAQHEAMLAALEKAYEEGGRERAGGRSVSMGFILGELSDLEDDDEEDGGAAVGSEVE